MSVLERGYSAFKRLVLMDDKVERMRTDIDELKSSVRNHQDRLIYVETVIALARTPQESQSRLPR
jgi:hypothetical protein